MLVDVSGPARAQLDEKLGRVRGRLLGGMRIHAFLPPRRGLRPKPQPAGGAQHGQRVEVRRLEEHVGGLGPDLAVLAAHDPGDRDRSGRIGDHQVLACEVALLSVEGRDLLAGLRAPHHDPSFVEPRHVERVERRAESEHDVVRHVDDVRDRPHARSDEARLHPDRSLAHRRTAEEPADVPGTAVEVLHPDVHHLVRCAFRVTTGRRRELSP